MPYYTIPPYPKQFEQVSAIRDMQGPASSFAFSHPILSLLLFLPLAFFAPMTLPKLDTKAAKKIAKRYHSLAWALRAWCHANNQECQFTESGDMCETSNDLDSPDSPITRALFQQDFYAWSLLRINVLSFDWKDFELFKEFHHDGAQLMIEREDENSPTGSVSILTFPSINYDNNLIAEMQEAIDMLDDITMKLVRFYNTHK